jgi:hypothetical protein
MTGADYRKEMNELRKGLESLDAHLTVRLMELAKLYPDAIIIDKPVDQIMAKCLTKGWVESSSMDVRIKYIENIEKWSDDRQNIKQLEI